VFDDGTALRGRMSRLESRACGRRRSLRREYFWRDEAWRPL